MSRVPLSLVLTATAVGIVATMIRFADAQPADAKRPTVPAADSVKASEGRLRKQLFVVQSTAAGGFAKLKENLKDHLAYLAELEKSGQLFMAGPLMNEDPTTWSGDGLLVLNAKDIEEAKGIAEKDPMHKSGARTFTLRPWLVNDGAMTFTVRLSDQKVQVK